jgi:hypothetical protein
MQCSLGCQTMGEVQKLINPESENGSFHKTKAKMFKENSRCLNRRNGHVDCESKP